MTLRASRLAPIALAFALTALASPPALALDWQSLPGIAKHIAVGGDGSLYHVGTNPVAGGFKIYKWNGSGWDEVPGGAVRIAVGPTGDLWAVNDKGNIFVRKNGNWQQLPGIAQDIAVGGDGSVYHVGTNRAPGGFLVYKWNGRGGWDLTGGAGVRVASGKNGELWVVNDEGGIFVLRSGAWLRLPGVAKEITAGLDGSIYHVGTNVVQGGTGIWKYNGSSWTSLNGGVVTLAAGPDGSLYGVNDAGQIYRAAPPSAIASGGDNKTLSIKLGHCQATLTSPQPWVATGNGRYKTDSHTAILRTNDKAGELPIVSASALNVDPNAFSVPLDTSVIPVPDKNKFLEDLKKGLTLASHETASMGIDTGKHILQKSSNLRLDPDNTYLYFVTKIPFAIWNKKDSEGNKVKTGEGSSKVQIMPSFVLDPCDPLVEIGGVSVSFDLMSVSLNALALSVGGNIPYTSKLGFWKGATRGDGTPDLEPWRMNAEGYLDGSVKIGFDKIDLKVTQQTIGIGFNGSVGINLDPNRDGLMPWSDALKVLAGKPLSTTAGSDVQFAIDGQGYVALPFFKVPLLAASVVVDAKDPVHPAFYFAGKQDLSVDLNEVFKDSPLKGKMKIGEDTQVLGYALFNQPGGRTNWGVKLMGEAWLADKKVEGDVDMSYDGQHVLLCAKFQGMDRICDMACAKDSDCQSDKACFFGVCAPRMPTGVPCYSDSQCQSKTCRGTCMECTKDSQCPSGKFCSTVGGAVFGVCSPKVGFGAPCLAADVCGAGLVCGGTCMECLATRGGPCPGGKYCGGDGRCHGKGGLGESCSNDNMCREGKCAFFKCQKTCGRIWSGDGCDGNTWCNGVGICDGKFGRDKSCSGNYQCRSNRCEYNVAKAWWTCK